MPHRLPQLNELLRQKISELFLKDDIFPKNCLVTITHVITAKDLSQAMVMVSVLPAANEKAVLKILKARTGYFQRLLAQILIIRKIPKIIFKFDESEEMASHIDKLLDKIHNQG